MKDLMRELKASLSSNKLDAKIESAIEKLEAENTQLKAELAARWRPIESARPEYDTLVVVTWDNRDLAVKLCQITYDDDGWLWADEHGDLCEWDSDEVPTHWMPLPNPTKDAS